MNLPFSLSPIIERELRVASRRNGTYWSRVGAAATGTVIFMCIMTAQLGVSPTPIAGRMAFRVLAGVAAFMVVASVLELAAAAFAREKREDTLALLFLTPLRPIELVLGKLVSCSLSAFYRFVAIIPLLALPLLAGGVTWSNFALLVLAIANVVFFAATLGLYVSVRVWDEKRATIVAQLTTFGLAVVLPALFATSAFALDVRGAWSFFALSPAFPIWDAMASGTITSWKLWGSLLLTQAMGWTFVWATCRTLPLCWQRKPVMLVPAVRELRLPPKEVKPRLRAGQPRLDLSGVAGGVKARHAVQRQFDRCHRASLLDLNPILWLASRWRAQSSSAWVIGSVGLAGLGLVAATGKLDLLFTPGMALFVSFCFNAAIKAYVGTEASLAFARDRGENTLELLLSTPIKPRELILGHWLAARRPARRWVRRALWFEGVWLALTISHHALNHGRETGLYLFGALAVMGFLIPDLNAVGWTALWQGVIAKNARTAEREAFTQVLLLPWFFAAFLGGLAGEMIVFLVCYTVFSTLADWWFARRSRRQLHANLALWAMRRSAGELEHQDGWQRAGRLLGRWWGKRLKRA